MRVQTALITINSKAILKILLIPEDDNDLSFLNDAWEVAVDHDVTYQRLIEPRAGLSGGK
jgi:hypothetical protein